MLVFTKIFILLTTAVFLALFMLIIEHPKRWKIGAGIFAFFAFFVLFSFPITAYIPMLCPFLILLDRKRLSWKACILYVSFFFLIISVWATLFIDLIPFYFYPIIVFSYVAMAMMASKKRKKETTISPKTV